MRRPYRLHSLRVIPCLRPQELGTSCVPQDTRQRRQVAIHSPQVHGASYRRWPCRGMQESKLVHRHTLAQVLMLLGSTVHSVPSHHTAAARPYVRTLRMTGRKCARIMVQAVRLHAHHTRSEPGPYVHPRCVPSIHQQHRMQDALDVVLWSIGRHRPKDRRPRSQRPSPWTTTCDWH